MSGRWRLEKIRGVWWHRPRWSKAKFCSGFFGGMPVGCPFFSCRRGLTKLLRRVWVLVLLAHALQLFVDLLRGFDSVGVVVRLGGVGGGCSGSRAWNNGRNDGIALDWHGRPGLHGLAGQVVGVRSVVVGD